MDVDVPVDSVVLALRRVRAAAYRVERDGEATTVALVLRVSPAGRRNAAERIVAELAERGLRVLADDPVAALTAGGAHRVVGAARR